MTGATFDWRKLVGSVAPVLGAVVGVANPMAGAGIAAIASAILGKPDATEGEVAAALSKGLTPEQVVALRQADDAFKVRMEELRIDVMKLQQAGDLALIADTSDARHVFGEKDNVFVMGSLILIGFFVFLVLVLVGFFLLLTGRFHVDPSNMAVIAGLIGTMVGYVAANAQQVVSFFYGSSKGSKDSGAQLGAAFQATIEKTTMSQQAAAPAPELRARSNV